jgi:predicted nucleic acid-binding Zn ribbon protein
MVSVLETQQRVSDDAQLAQARGLGLRASTERASANTRSAARSVASLRDAESTRASISSSSPRRLCAKAVAKGSTVGEWETMSTTLPAGRASAAASSSFEISSVTSSTGAWGASRRIFSRW